MIVIRMNDFSLWANFYMTLKTNFVVIFSKLAFCVLFCRYIYKKLF